MKLLPPSLPCTACASDLSSRSRASSCARSRSKRLRLASVARSALPRGSRKLRAKPSLTVTTSPICPRRPMRSSRITCIVEAPFLSACSATGGRLTTLAQAEQRLGKAENGDNKGNPAQQQNSELDGCKQNGAERRAAAIDMNHREPLQHVSE